MPRANFCVECGERLARKGWRLRLGGRLCAPCARRLGTDAVVRPLIILVLVAAGAFVFGRYLRPVPPPLIIQRLASSPLSDLPVDSARSPRPTNTSPASSQNQSATVTSDEGYICGARTKKGTPCRRRVHVVGERCFQHKGLGAMAPLEKLVIKATNSNTR